MLSRISIPTALPKPYERSRNRPEERRQTLLPSARSGNFDPLGRGIAWLDTGTHEALLQASTFIQTLEERQGLMVACVEEIAYRMGYITSADVLRLARPMRDNSYGEYLRRLVEPES